MSNKSTYQLPNAEMLKRFYEGKLSSSEMESVMAMLEKDELLKEAFLGLNSAGFEVVEKISATVDERVRKAVAPPPYHLRWKIWLSVFIGVVSVSSFFALYDFNRSGNEKKITAFNKVEKNEPEHTKAVVNKPRMVTVESFYMTEEETRTMRDMHGETTRDFHSVSNPKTVDEKKNETDPKIVTDNKTNVDGPADNKAEEKKNNLTTDNPNTIDPGKKTYRIRIEDVAVINTQNLAEKEASSGEDRENMDVRDINLGNDAGSKRNVSFSLEDMPRYKGGDEALAAYVKGKIALKSYNLKESSVSTVAEFVVNSKGKVEDIKFQNPLDASMEKDIRDILSAVTFTPGKKSGKKGSMYYMMALMFGN